MATRDFEKFAEKVLQNSREMEKYYIDKAIEYLKFISKKNNNG